MTRTPAPGDRPVTLRLSAAWLVALVLLPAVVGAALALAVEPLAAWLEQTVGASWYVGLLDRLPTPWAAVALTLAGLVLGLTVADAARTEGGVVVVHRDHLEVGRGEPSRWVDRAATSRCHRDAKELVVIGRRGEQLARVPVDDVSPQTLRRELTAAGWPWAEDGDPFEADFTPWLDGSPALTPEQHRLLRRREDTDAADRPALDTELAEQSLVVRDRRSRQQWRPVRPT